MPTKSKNRTRGSKQFRGQVADFEHDEVGSRLPDELGKGYELADELIERSLARAQVRSRFVEGEIPADVRDQLTNEVIDDLLGGRCSEEELVGPGGLLAQLTGRLVERALSGELTEHLGYPAGEAPTGGAGNSRNGVTSKTLSTEHGPVTINTPRDRKGVFEPALVKKNQTRFVGFDDKILAMYSRGMTVRDIEAHLTEMYGTSVGRDTISRVTAAVFKDANEWQTRPLERIYPIVYMDALRVKIRDERVVDNHACYLAIGVNTDGEREVLGMWFQQTEGAKFWMQVLADLKQRGVQDVLVCCVDGLTGFPEAIEAVYPKTWVQTCVVHQVRNSMQFVSYKDRRKVAADLKQIYTATDRDHAERELENFAEKWDARYPMISASWIENWEQIVPFLAFPPDVRRVIYTTNTIESLNSQIRKNIKTRGHFPNQDAARKLIYLSIINAQKNWKQTCNNWNAALTAFRIHFGDRLPNDL